MNLIVIHGRLARDPETKTYTNQKGENGTICSFSVAVDRRIGEEADFFNCKCFGKRGEVIAKFFKKGKEIVVSGEMQCHKYEDKDGNKRTSWDLSVNDFDFCGKKDGDSPIDNIPEGMIPIDDSDIPF